MSASDPSRETQKVRFLERAGFSGATRQSLSGDASTRLYERLTTEAGETFIFMDQPRSAESDPAPPDATPQARRDMGYNALTRLAAGRIEAFVAVGGYLRSLGLSAPDVLAFDPAEGLAVIEDLGDGLFASLLSTGAPAETLYGLAVEVQAELHRRPPPDVLEAQGVRWPLNVYDDLALQTYADLFLEWWPRYAGLEPFPQAARAEFERLTRPVRLRGEKGAAVFAHRDFHAENLLWLPKRTGLRQVGLLDFQDAVKAHPAWDLLHLLQDARREVPEALEETMLGRYLALRPPADERAFLADYRALAALNAARILGPIFARQVIAFGRPKYAAFMPRTWRYLERDLGHPDLEELKAWFDRWIPRSGRP